MALESQQLNAVMIEEGHYTVGETKKGRHNDAGDEKRTKAVVNQPKLAMYHIDMKYIRDLHRADDKVPSVSPQIGKANRVFLGIIVLLHGQKYCIPLSHPKEKHDNMKGRIDFTKIIDKDGKLLGVLNFNLMIPVEDEQMQKVDFRSNKNDSLQVTRYKKLCQKELIWCRKNQYDIANKANLIYKMYSSGEQFSARSRCVNYPKLEGVCHKYNSKEK